MDRNDSHQLIPSATLKPVIKQSTEHGIELRFSEVEELPGTIVIHVAGSIDLATVIILLESMENAVEHGFPKVIMDVQGVSFMGSGTASLVQGLKTVKPHEGQLLVAAVPEMYQNLFESEYFLGEAIPTYGSIDEAIRSCDQNDGI